ncbi:P-II family nitrogen regulator [Stappia sp.]|uniref:P-II family nitrogen regulator n=1 Tax=Stappia sp. TaxID=1870903 RepID=UPI0032D978DA
MHAATKIVIITERSILDDVADLLEAHGATGYTYTSAGGKGSRGKRRIDRVPQVAGILENVKIEAIVPDHDVAERITEAVVEAYFDNYSGITYVEPVEILRPAKFRV